jgi:hypothetical protein
VPFDISVLELRFSFAVASSDICWPCTHMQALQVHVCKTFLSRSLLYHYISSCLSIYSTFFSLRLTYRHPIHHKYFVCYDMFWTHLWQITANLIHIQIACSSEIWSAKNNVFNAILVVLNSTSYSYRRREEKKIWCLLCMSFVFDRKRIYMSTQNHKFKTTAIPS